MGDQELKSAWEITQERLKKLDEKKSSILEEQIAEEVKRAREEGIRLFHEGKIDEARKFFESKEYQYIDRIEILSGIQDIHFFQKNYNSTTLYGEKIIKKGMLHTECAARTYFAYKLQNMDSEAERLYRHIIEQIPGEKNSKIAIMADLATGYDYQDLALSIVNNIDSEELEPYKLTKIGSIYKQKKEYEKAKNILKKALQIKNENQQPRYGALKILGGILFDEKKYRKAITCLEQAVASKWFEQERDIEKESMYSTLMYAFHKIGKRKKEIQYGEQLIDMIKSRSRMDGDPYAIWWLAKTYQQDGQIDKAIEALNLGIQIKPQEESFGNLLTSIFCHKKDWKGSIEVRNFLMGKSAIKDFGFHFNNLAEEYWMLKDYSNAFKALDALKWHIEHEMPDELKSTIQEYNNLRLGLSRGAQIFNITARIIFGENNIHRLQRKMLNYIHGGFDGDFGKLYDKRMKVIHFDKRQAMRVDWALIKDLFKKKENRMPLEKRIYWHMKDVEHLDLYAISHMNAVNGPEFEEAYNKVIIDFIKASDMDEQTINLVDNPSHSEEVKSINLDDENTKPMTQRIIVKRSKLDDQNSYNKINLESKTYKFYSKLFPDKFPPVLAELDYEKRKYLILRMVDGKRLGDLIPEQTPEETGKDLRDLILDVSELLYKGTFVSQIADDKDFRDILGHINPKKIDYIGEITSKFLPRIKAKKSIFVEKSIEEFLNYYKNIDSFLKQNSIFLIHGDLNLNNIIKASNGEKKILDTDKMSIGTIGYEIMPLLFDYRIHNKQCNIDIPNAIEILYHDMNGFGKMEVKGRDAAIGKEEFFRMLGVNSRDVLDKGKFMASINVSCLHRNLSCVGMFTEMYLKDNQRYFAECAAHHLGVSMLFFDDMMSKGDMSAYGKTMRMKKSLLFILRQSEFMNIVEKEKDLPFQNAIELVKTAY